MKKSLAVKSLSAGLGALLFAGPAAAQEVAAPSMRASLGALSAAAVVPAPSALPSAAALSAGAPALSAPALSLSAPVAAPAALAAAPVAAAAAAASAPAVEASVATPASAAAAPAAPALASLAEGFVSAPARDDSGAKGGGDARFDGARAAASAPVVAGLVNFSEGATPELIRSVAEKAALVQRLRAEIGKVIVGQQEMVDSIIMALISSEHVLLEGVPGVAKTQAVKAAADAVSGDFKRIQGTPDKLPSDIIGAEILQDDPERPGFKVIQVQFGPVFTNILLVDEINRMMPKTQSALLEAMAEGQVTIGTKTYKLSKPFLVIATQNPIEQEGTYRLPEAQQDRFMLKTTVPLPSTQELLEIMERFSSKDNQPKADKVHSLAELDEIRRIADKVYVAPSLKAYIADIVEATSQPAKYGIALAPGAIERDGGAGPRAAIYLLKAARVHALMEGRAWVGPGDIAAVAHRILRHRITLGFSAPRDLTSDKVVDAVLARVPVPAR